MKSSLMGLLRVALIKIIMGWCVMALLLFLPAGTIQYTAAWHLMALLFVPMLIIGVVLMVRSPQLLARRLQSKEKRQVQQGVIKFSALIFIASFIVSGIDYRYDWSHVSPIVSHVAALLFLVGYALYAEVMRENEWLSRSVQVESEQTVVTTGLYGIVRHPMYTATLLMFLAMPIVLGSLWATLIMLLYIPIIVRRIIDEERLLLTELKGYDHYCRNLRWRLVPGIW